MSVTIVSLVVGAVGFAAKQITSNPQVMNAVKYGLMSQRREISQAADKAVKSAIDYHNAYRDDGWTVDAQYLETKLNREYELEKNKSVRGMGEAVYQYFSGLTNVNVSKETEGNSQDYMEIVCKAKLPRSVAGGRLNLRVAILKRDNKALVTYESPTNEVINAIQGLGLSFFLLGAGKLAGQVLRHQIPEELNAAIQQYLEQ